MAGRIPEETLQTIRDRVSLVDLVSTYVRLRQTGRNHVGLCPFHDEKTPSFSVSDERGFFKCFGCGAGGNAFTFLMRIERIEFPEAVEQLAKRAGVALPEQTAGSPVDQTKESLVGLNEKAAAFFRRAWEGSQGDSARRYLEDRGLATATIEQYGIGFAPAGGTELTRWFGRNGVSRRTAVQSGLIGEKDGRLYDRFRGRIMFPIRDRRGRVIAFGGRALGDEQPKYLNSPESPIFTKGDGLYGIAEARAAIRDADRVVLVEGYMDALMLVQAGIPYVVATLGTALTPSQLRLVRGIGGEQAVPYFLFDGDRAGRQAALRAFAVCAEAGVWGRPAFLPDGMDPDDFVRQRGVEETLALLDHAPELLDFYFDETLPPGADLPVRTRAARDVRRVLDRISDPIQFELVARRAAQRLGLSDTVFARSAATVAPAAPGERAGATPWPVAERMLLEVVALDEDVARWVVERDILDSFQHGALAAAIARLIDAWEAGEGIGAVVDQLPDDIAGHVRGVLLADENGLDRAGRMQMAEDCVLRVHEHCERDRRRAVVAELRRAEREGDEDSEKELLRSLDGMRRREGDRL
jgi:DNA primase